MKKNIIRLFAAAAASMFAFSCTPDFPTPDKSQLPEAGKLTPVITVDQETNYVTFSIEEAGVVPMWIFGEDKVDGKANKKYAYTGNGISLRIREEGTHTVELKAYNANGISLGSQMVEYSLNNTFRDPFDPTPYMKAIANTWTWDSENKGHFGCGPSFEEPLSWWSCDPNGKANEGLYDDLMTFTEDGQYTFNPGKGGTVYVNWGSGFKPEGHEEEIAGEKDYQAPIDEYTSTYTIENNWNDAGIEEIFLVLAEGANLSYIPNPEALTTNTRYQFKSTKTADIKKNLQVVNHTPAIGWMYSFVPFVKTATPEEILAGTDDKGKVWVMDSQAKGHLACGPNVDDPISWWAAGADEKAGWGMYDNELTFFPDGSYTFNPGEDGAIYVNKGVTLIGADVNPHNDADFKVTVDEQKTTYTFDGETLSFPEGTFIGYVPNDAVYTNPTYVVKSISEAQLVLVSVSDGISWQYIFRPRDYKAPAQTIGGKEVAGGKVELSLQKGANVAVTGIDLATYWIDTDWFEAVDASNVKFIGPDGDYIIMNADSWLKVIPASDGEAAVYPNTIWVIGEGAGKPEGGQPGWSTGIAADIPFVKNGNTYTATLYCRDNTNIKLFEQADWGDDNTGERVWLANRYGSFEGNGFFEMPAADGNIHAASGLEAGWYVFTAVDKDGDGALALSIDKKKETSYEIDAETNLWRSATITPSIWYTSAANWDGGVNPEYEIGENNSFSVVIPEEMGHERWKGQNKLRSGVAVSADKLYDFCATFLATEDAEITVKLTGWDSSKDNDDDNFFMFYQEVYPLTAGEPSTLKLPKLSPKNSCDDFVFIVDLGLCAPETQIDITNICLQEHIEK